MSVTAVCPGRCPRSSSKPTKRPSRRSCRSPCGCPPSASPGRAARRRTGHARRRSRQPARERHPVANRYAPRGVALSIAKRVMSSSGRAGARVCAGPRRGGARSQATLRLLRGSAQGCGRCLLGHLITTEKEHHVTPAFAIASIVTLDVALLALLAFVMAQPRRLRPTSAPWRTRASFSRAQRARRERRGGSSRPESRRLRAPTASAGSSGGPGTKAARCLRSIVRVRAPSRSDSAVRSPRPSRA